MKNQNFSEKEKAFSNYVSTITHDLRSPLNTIIQLSEFLLAEEERRDEETLEQFIVLINATAKDMFNMVETYLILQRLKQGAKIEKERKNTLSILNEIKEIFSKLKSGKKLEIFYKNFKDNFIDPLLFSNEVEVNQIFKIVFTNLFSNATEASLKDKSIMMNFFKEDNFLVISLTNSGEVPENIRNNLFTPAVTTKKNGNGFGLYSSKLIIEAHGGCINYESIPDGTRFIVKLPLVK